MRERKPLKLVDEHSWIAGVCGGIAYACGMPVVLVRILFVLFVFALSGPDVDYVGGVLFLVYILLWAFAPEWDPDPEDYSSRTA